MSADWWQLMKGIFPSPLSISITKYNIFTFWGGVIGSSIHFSYTCLTFLFHKTAQKTKKVWYYWKSTYIHSFLFLDKTGGRVIKPNVSLPLYGYIFIYSFTQTYDLIICDHHALCLWWPRSCVVLTDWGWSWELRLEARPQTPALSAEDSTGDSDTNTQL